MQQRSPPASWQKDSEQTQGSDPLSPTSACKTASGVCLVHKESSGLSPVDGHQDSQGLAEHDIEGQPEKTTPLQLGEDTGKTLLLCIHDKRIQRRWIFSWRCMVMGRETMDKLEHVKFQLDLGKKFTIKMVKYRNSLPRKAVESPPFHMFRTWLYRALTNPISLHFNILSRMLDKKKVSSKLCYDSTIL